MEDLKDYKEHIQFCEYCGNIITDDGRCPDLECVHNLLMDVLGELDDDTQEDNIEAGQDDSRKDEEGAE